MEARAPYMQRRDSPAEAAAVYATKLRFNGKMTAFGDICPGHLEKTRGGGEGGKRPPRQRGRRGH